MNATSKLLVLIAGVALTTQSAFAPPNPPRLRVFQTTLNKDNSPSWRQPQPQEILTAPHNETPVGMSEATSVEETVGQDGRSGTPCIIMPEHMERQPGVLRFMRGRVWIAGNALHHQRLPRDLVVGSVGGNRTAAPTLITKEREGAKIASQPPIISATDAGVDTAVCRVFGTGRFLARAFMKHGQDLNAADENTRNIPNASPLRASNQDLGGPPPAVVNTAETACRQGSDMRAASPSPPFPGWSIPTGGSRPRLVSAVYPSQSARG